MIDEELVEMINIRKTIVVVTRAQAQVVKLRQVINYSGDGIEAGEIQFAEAIVEEELLHDPEFRVERLGDARLIQQSDPGSYHEIILFTAADKRGVRGPEKGRVNGSRERLILLNLLQDLLLADVFLIRTRERVTLSLGAGRNGRERWISLAAQQLSAVLSLTGRYV